MGHSLICVLASTAAGLIAAAPGSAFAMSSAKAKTPPQVTSTHQPTSLPSLTSDGHHYRAIVFGGSCEEGQATNDFHDSFIKSSSALNAAGWDVRPLFAGDSAHCSLPSTDSHCQGTLASTNCCRAGIDLTQWSVNAIASAAGKDPSSVGRASKANLLASLDQAAADLASGDELLIVIDTHGYGEQVPGQSYWEHGICISSDLPDGTVSNADPLTGDASSVNKEGLMYMSDPDLQQRLKKLSSLGVKMAFFDGSCYGGGSIPTLSPYGCVISSSSSRLENSETGMTSSNVNGTEESENGIAFNLPDLLQQDSNDLATLSLHPNKLTAEEFWLRILARSKIDDMPEFSGFMSDALEAESLGDWSYGIEGDVTYRHGRTPFTNNPGANVYTAGPLMNYAQTYLNSISTPTSQASDASLVSNYWSSPGYPGNYDSVTSKNLPELKTQIAGLQTQWDLWVSQFNALTAQESAIKANLSTLNINVQWSFTGELSGTEALLNTVLSTIQNQSVFTYPTAQKGNPWVESGDNFNTPDSSDFDENTAVATDTIGYFMNAYKLSHDDYISGLDDSYSGALGAMIAQAERKAWNSATPSAQNQMKSDFQQLEQLRAQETVLLTQLVVDTKAYTAQARMYSYLGYRAQAGQKDAQLTQCGDFVLKRY